MGSRSVSLLLLPLLAGAGLAAAAAEPDRALEEARANVVDLLDSLVAKGIVTRDQALQMVADAQNRTLAEAQARAEREEARRDADAQAAQAATVETAGVEDSVEPGSVRVTYVPQIVRDDISAQVREELRPAVVQDVVQQAREEGWGVPAGLPDWVRGLKLSGDVRVRGQADLFASDNIQFSYLDYLTVNEKGGIAKAGEEAFLNVTEDRLRARLRARLGVEARLGNGFTTGLRLATGNFRDPVSTNQTLAQVGGRYSFGLDQAYVRYDTGTEDPWLTLVAGRSTNPFFSTDLVYDTDLTFEGFWGRYSYGLDAYAGDDDALDVTIGAFPLEEVELSGDDKWLYAAQLGMQWTFAQAVRLRGALAYYFYDNVTGRLNPFESTVYDYTAPAWLQKGNTLFDIRNDADTSTNLFALAAEYQLASVVFAVETPLLDEYQLAFFADYVTNLGFDEAEVAARTGVPVEGRTDGYQVELGFGHPALDRLHAWRAALRYRYLQRDAVLDAFTDSDFHLGGTDGQGYVLRGDYALGPKVYLTLRYLTANEIDGPPLGIDVVQLDLNGRF